MTVSDVSGHQGRRGKEDRLNGQGAVKVHVEAEQMNLLTRKLLKRHLVCLPLNKLDFFISDNICLQFVWGVIWDTFSKLTKILGITD